jgi:hypothetical protein
MMYVTLETPCIWSIHGGQSMLYTIYVYFSDFSYFRQFANTKPVLDLPAI